MKMTKPVTAKTSEQLKLFVDPPVEDYDVDECLPTPVGYRVLIALPQVEETFGGTGLIKSTKTVHEEHIMSIIGLVVDLGTNCYKDADKFPEGPWCKAGDYVMFRANSGTRFKFGGLEYRLMNDDNIEAVVPDPKAISRV
jgi:co-chaperonin GroES (HSP10)|tara:strand:- start:372 stop:791 length:420 start_codon:yes stop_codon:yes gene_type:complete